MSGEEDLYKGLVPHDEDTEESDKLDFGTLNESGIRTKNEQVRVVFQELRVFLCGIRRVGIRCMCLDRLENKIDGPVDSELSRQCHTEYMDIALDELASTPQRVRMNMTHRVSRSSRSTISRGCIWPLTLASIQLVFSFSSFPRAMWYTDWPGSSALTANVVLTCTREPPSSMVRTIAVFSNAGPAKEKEGSSELTKSSDRVCQRCSIVSRGGCVERRVCLVAVTLIFICRYL